MTDPAMRFLQRQLDLFDARCQELAERVTAGVTPFVEAVDLAYSAAVWSGLSEVLGDDVVQKTMAQAFMGIQRKGGF
jgi:hypothetical protein